MKLRLLAFALLLTGGVSAQNPYIALQGANETASGVTIAQPRTILAVDVTVERDLTLTGPYARYAQKYLGVRGPLADKTTWSITGAQIALLDQPLSLTLKNSINCMIAFLPHALAASIVQILFWGVVILCMPLGLLLMLVFGFWFVTEVSCQIVYGDLDRVFHIEESIRKLKDAELEAALREDYAAAEDDTEE